MARHIEHEIYIKNSQVLSIASKMRAIKEIQVDLNLKIKSLEEDLRQAKNDLRELIKEQANGNKDN